MTNSSQIANADAVLTSIRQIVRRISEHSKAMSQDLGLTIPQMLCLRAIGQLEGGQNGEITVALVAAEVQLSAATVSRIIDRLVRADLVTRERGLKDRRRVCLALTVKGLERYQTLPAPLQERFVARFESLPANERDAIVKTLHHIVELMDASELDAAPILAPGTDVKGEYPGNS